MKELRKISQEDLEKALYENRRFFDYYLEGGKQCDLSHFDLRGKDLSDLCFMNVSLYGSDLTGANLDGADFRGAELIDAIYEDYQIDEAIIDDETEF